MVDRRKALSAIGTVSLAGLAGCLSDLLPGGDETTSETSLTETIVEGDTWYSGTSGADEIEYTVDVLEGPRVDVLLVDRSGFNALEDGNFDQFTYYENMSDTHTRLAEASGELESDFYALVIDNSDNIGASPAGPGDATVDIEYTLTFGA